MPQPTAFEIQMWWNGVGYVEEAISKLEAARDIFVYQTTEKVLSDYILELWALAEQIKEDLKKLK